MYIIELFFKIKNEIKKRKQKTLPKTREYETCNHFFVPIDSTGRILACSKCGELYKLKDGEINPFEDKNRPLD